MRVRHTDTQTERQKIDTHPDTASWHINASNDSGKQPEVNRKKRESGQPENSMTWCVHEQFIL